MQLHINVAPLAISPAALPDGTEGQPYSVQLTPSGGSSAGYNVTVSGLPIGLTFSPAWVISGTPGQAGDFNVVVAVTDNGGNSATF